MKSKDYFVLKKIIEYCNQVDEAINMFGNDFDRFAKNSVFRNACCKIMSRRYSRTNKMKNYRKELEKA